MLKVSRVFVLALPLFVAMGDAGLAQTVAQPAVQSPTVAAPAAPAPAAAVSTATIPTTAAPTGSAAALPPDTAVIGNPYGLPALWQAGDLIARTTLILLLLMSLATWYLLISKGIQQTVLNRQRRAAIIVLGTSKRLSTAIENLAPNSIFRFLAEAGFNAKEQYKNCPDSGELSDNIDLHTWVSMSLDRATGDINSSLQAGLAVLATIGSTAPFIGLFGTVWGIYHALTAIGIAGQASIDKVAGPVGESLIMTAIGLATAVPAVLGYNFLVRRNKTVMEAVRNFAADLHGILISGRIGMQSHKQTQEERAHASVPAKAS
jgi:biopolymer transport protein ExbB